MKVLLFLFLSCSLFAQTIDSLKFPEEKHLKNIRMLTHDGENAEAYLSFDGTQLILQSTHNGLPCDQIFTMGMDGSNFKMVSNGKGRTTCSYFLPGDSTIIYASTYHADENCPPPADRSKGYVWKLYETFDIYKADKDGNNIIPLTNSFGYDAEATVSPVGNKIIFTSTRDGDPELYTMNLDGSDQKRLTFEKGYDGGAFYSQDGKKIIFRASRPKTEKDFEDYNDLVKNGYVRPTALELQIMDADGSNLKQITNLGKASFAPYFFPDGKKVIFSSNAGGNSVMNFDLYMINIDGTGLERITYYDSFDGFPVFTKDGKHLIFASNRFSQKKGETNIFIADWVE